MPEGMRKENIKGGVIFREMILPDRIKLEMRELNDGTWSFHYMETLTNASEASLQNAIKYMNSLGFKVRRRGKTLSMKAIGSRETLVSALITELISMSNLGDVSLRELILLATVSYNYFRTRLEKIAYLGATGEDRGEKRG